jgi:hypothetical protein
MKVWVLILPVVDTYPLNHNRWRQSENAVGHVWRTNRCEDDAERRQLRPWTSTERQSSPVRYCGGRPVSLTHKNCDLKLDTLFRLQSCGEGYQDLEQRRWHEAWFAVELDEADQRISVFADLSHMHHLCRLRYATSAPNKPKNDRIHRSVSHQHTDGDEDRASQWCAGGRHRKWWRSLLHLQILVEHHILLWRKVMRMNLFELAEVDWKDTIQTIDLLCH